MNFSIKDIVKDNFVRFHHYRAGYLYYSVVVPSGEMYIFPIPISDTGEASFEKEDKAILFMRYIRKAIEEKTFTKI